MLNLATQYDAVKYTALLTEGTFTEYELGTFAMARTHYVFSPDIIHTTVENMANANMIRLLDTIPCNLYITNDPDMWEDEAKKFFADHAKEFAGGDQKESSPLTSIKTARTSTSPSHDTPEIPKAATVAQEKVDSTPTEEKEKVKTEREMSYAERMNKNSYFNRMKDQSKKKKKKE